MAIMKNTEGGLIILAHEIEVDSSFKSFIFIIHEKKILLLYYNTKLLLKQFIILQNEN